MDNDTNAINIYRVKPHEHLTGWIILSLALTAFAVLFLVLWIVELHNNSGKPPCKCFGPFGVEAGVDGTTLTTCGTDRATPCVFTMNSIAACENQCNVYRDICQAFSYNSSTNQMKIVSTTGTFASPAFDLYLRQDGVIN